MSKFRRSMGLPGMEQDACQVGLTALGGEAGAAEGTGV